jgi:hypothetical protein
MNLLVSQWLWISSMECFLIFHLSDNDEFIVYPDADRDEDVVYAYHAINDK